MTYIMSTMLAVNAAAAPAHVEFPAFGLSESYSRRSFARLTVEEGIQGEEVDANGSCKHGYCESQQLDDDRPGRFQRTPKRGRP